MDAFPARFCLCEDLEFSAEAVYEDAAEVAGVDVVEGLVRREDTQAGDERRREREVRQSSLQLRLVRGRGGLAAERVEGRRGGRGSLPGRLGRLGSRPLRLLLLR